MKSTVITALTLAIVPVLAIPPEDFGFPSAPNDTVLSVAFPAENGSDPTTLQPGALFGIDVPAVMPRLGLQTNVYESLASYNGSYLVCMVDPDAPTPQSPTRRFILHWLEPDFTLYNGPSSDINLGLLPGAVLLTNNSAALVPYQRPAPSPTSDPHRYILYAFRQPDNFSLPAAYEGYSRTNRTSFNLTRFISDTNLGTPAAANYMYATNQTTVPVDFIGAPGSSYPEGNGGAVTSGDPGATAVPTGTSSSSSGASSASTATSMASAASSASSTSSAGAAMITGMSGLVGAGLIGLAALL